MPRSALAGLAAGVASGLFGVGGGILLVPLLLAQGTTQHQAHGTSLAVIGFTALAGLVVYAAHGHVAWLTALIMATASVLTAPLGARIANRLSSDRLRRVFAIFLVIVAVRMLVNVPEVTPLDIHRGWMGAALDLALGAGVGLLAGFMGIGGGLLSVPVLTLAFGLSQQTAQGTSLAVILVTGPVAAIEHARHGNVRKDLVPGLVVGALLGAPLASLAVQWLPHAILVRGFAVFLVVNAIAAWWKTRGQGAPPA